MKHFGTEITGRLEALICTGDRIESAVLSELAAANRAASGAQPSERGCLTVLLAVYFCDIYLIKPLVELGFSPNAKVDFLDDEGMESHSPIEAAIRIRCEPVIRELPDNKARLTYTCNDSPWYPLLDHSNLPPSTCIESITRVVGLLMPTSTSERVACICEPRTTCKDGNCYDWTYEVLDQGMDMPTDLSHLQMPLVTHLTDHLVSGNNSSRDTADSALCNAIQLYHDEAFDFLIDTADEATLKAWLCRKDSKGLSPLFEAIMDAVANSALSLHMVRSLLDKGAKLGRFR